MARCNVVVLYWCFCCWDDAVYIMVIKGLLISLQLKAADIKRKYPQYRQWVYKKEREDLDSPYTSIGVALY